MFTRYGSTCQKQLDTFTAARVAGFNRHASINTPVGMVDISWLEAAAAQYRISADPYNYVFSINRIVVCDIPNRNLDMFETSELQRFHTVAGKEVYKTFEAKPLYFEHNQVFEDARGVIFKSFITTEGPYRVVTNLVGADKLKDSNLARDIQSGRRPYFSMGCLAQRIKCPVCGRIFAETEQFCEHLRNLGKVYGSQLAYEILMDILFCEESSVADPAALIAGKGDMNLDMGKAIPSNGNPLLF